MIHETKNLPGKLSWWCETAHNIEPSINHQPLTILCITIHKKTSMLVMWWLGRSTIFWNNHHLRSWNNTEKKTLPIHNKCWQNSQFLWMFFLKNKTLQTFQESSGRFRVNLSSSCLGLWFPLATDVHWEEVISWPTRDEIYNLTYMAFPQNFSRRKKFLFNI